MEAQAVVRRSAEAHYREPPVRAIEAGRAPRVGRFRLRARRCVGSSRLVGAVCGTGEPSDRLAREMLTYDHAINQCKRGGVKPCRWRPREVSP